MKLDAVRIVLGKPALHALVTLLLAIAFVWPFLANTTPHRTWFFLHGVWLFSVLALVAISRGREPSENEDDATSDGRESK